MAANRRPTALLVDDDPLSQKAGRARLGHAGYAVFAAEGHASALSQARKTRPDVIYVHLGSDGGSLSFIAAIAMHAAPDAGSVPTSPSRAHLPAPSRNRGAGGTVLPEQRRRERWSARLPSEPPVIAWPSDLGSAP